MIKFIKNIFSKKETVIQTNEVISSPTSNIKNNDGDIVLGSLSGDNIEKSFKTLNSGSMLFPEHPALVTLNNLHDARNDEVDLQELKSIAIEDIPIALDPKEILFLKYVDGWRLSHKPFPKYWTFEHNLNLQSTLKKLYKYKFIAFGDIDIKLSHLTVNELKDILKKYNLKISGRKQELIDRLIEGVSNRELESLVKEDSLSITEKGKKVINDNQYVFNTFELSLEEASKVMNEGNTDLSLYAINKRIDEYNKRMNAKEYGLATTSLIAISKIYKDIGDKEKELVFLIRLLANGLFEGTLTLQKMINLTGSSIALEMFKGYEDKYFVAPATLNRIFILHEESGISLDEIKELAWKEVLELPITIKKIDFENRFNEAIEEHRKDLEAIKIIK